MTLKSQRKKTMPLYVDLITPERQVASEEVDYISVPTIDGQIGILPHHASLLAPLGMGELKLRSGDVTKYIAITGGFLEIQSGSRVKIFAETAEMADEIDIERARLALERAKAKLTAEQQIQKMDFAVAEAALARAILRIKIAENRRRSPSAASTGVR